MMPVTFVTCSVPYRKMTTKQSMKFSKKGNISDLKKEIKMVNVADSGAATIVIPCAQAQ